MDIFSIKCPNCGSSDIKNYKCNHCGSMLIYEKWYAYSDDYVDNESFGPFTSEQEVKDFVYKENLKRSFVKKLHYSKC